MLSQHLSKKRSPTMRLGLGAICLGVLTLAFNPVAQAQDRSPSDRQVGALVEALRRAAPPNSANDGLYSEWQVKPENIPRWSRSCTGRELTPAAFEASPDTARSILVCVMRDVLQEESRNSRNDEALAVRRAASWWMTGEPGRYQSGDIATYTQRVLAFYQQQMNAARTPSSPGDRPASEPPSVAVFDRYMQAGYAATQAREYQIALINFQRALDERPNDPFARRAIQNVQGYLARPDAASEANEPAAPAPPAN